MSNLFQGTLYHSGEKTRTPVSIQVESGCLRIYADTAIQTWAALDIQSARRLGEDLVILQNGAWYLEVQSPGFAPTIEQAWGNKRLFRKSFFDKAGIAGCLIVLLGILLPLLAVFLWLTPFLADRAAREVSPEVERQIGDAWYQSLTAASTIDSAKTQLVQQFYDSLHFGGPYDMRITVVREPVVNAYAVPGGHIVVFDSIIGLMDAPEQLAGLLAHEASHIQLRHSTRAIFRELGARLFLNLAFGNYGDLSGIIAQHGSQLGGLSYSRQLELEADRHGLDLLKKSRAPQQGMPGLFRKMQAAAPAGDSEIPNFWSTHPAISERIAEAEAQIAASGNIRDTVPDALRHIWSALK
ncbi:MAG: M48 family metallopeptidase [Saprospirales bacterium]|nr:M48 family metallopeptidase [Saprospirales bacterium]